MIKLVNISWDKRQIMRFLNFNWLSRAYNLGLSFRELAALIVLSLIATVTEVFGIGMFLPIFQFIRLEGDFIVPQQIKTTI